MKKEALALARSRFRDIFLRYGGPIKEKEWGFIAPCPMHGGTGEDHFSWSDSRGTWVCYSGKCGRGADPITFIMKMEGLSFWRALLFSYYLLGMEGGTENLVEEKEVVYEEGPLCFSYRDIEQDLQLLDTDAIYQQSGILCYLQKRHIPKEIATRFNVGYARGGPLKSRLVLPILAQQPSPPTIFIGAQGRTLSDDTLPKYLNYGTLPGGGFPCGRVLFNWSQCPGRLPLLIVEGPLCCMRAVEYGWEDSVALLGKHLSPIRGRIVAGRYRDVVLALDPDAEDVIPDILRTLDRISSGMRVSILEMTPGVDVDRMSRDEFRGKMRQAIGNWT